MEKSLNERLKAEQIKHKLCYCLFGTKGCFLGWKYHLRCQTTMLNKNWRGRNFIKEIRAEQQAERMKNARKLIVKYL